MAFCYDPVGSRCLGHQAGVNQLQTWLIARYPKTFNLGTYVCRGNTGGAGLSLHAEGRAGDTGVPFRHPSGFAIRDFLITNAADLGVQEVIWDRRIWHANRPYLRDYGGPNPHTDHVHWALCWRTARTLTVNWLNLRYPAGGAVPVPAPPTEDPDMPASPIQRGTSGPLFAVIGGRAKPLGSLDELTQYVNAGLVKSGPHYSMNPSYFDALFGNPPRWP